jgi:hypothetical protein
VARQISAPTWILACTEHRGTWKVSFTPTSICLLVTASGAHISSPSSSLMFVEFVVAAHCSSSRQQGQRCMGVLKPSAHIALRRQVRGVASHKNKHVHQQQHHAATASAARCLPWLCFVSSRGRAPSKPCASRTSSCRAWRPLATTLLYSHIKTTASHFVSFSCDQKIRHTHALCPIACNHDWLRLYASLGRDLVMNGWEVRAHERFFWPPVAISARAELADDCAFSVYFLLAPFWPRTWRWGRGEPTSGHARRRRSDGVERRAAWRGLRHCVRANDMGRAARAVRVAAKASRMKGRGSHGRRRKKVLTCGAHRQWRVRR